MITGMPRIAIATYDFHEVMSLFRDKLGMPVIEVSDVITGPMGIQMAMCVPEGGSNIELMSPVDRSSPLGRSLTGFIDRRGEGLFALMLEAPVPDDEADDLAGRGLNVMPLMEGAFGRDVHPNSTHGVLIRVYPVDSFEGRKPDQSDQSNAPGLSGIARVIIAVRDLDHAVEVYGEQFNMTMDDALLDNERGVRSAICRPPTGGVIELIEVDNATRPFAQPIADFLETRREGMYALVLETNNIEATASALTARALKFTVAADSPQVLEVAREEAFGTLIRIESTN